MANLPAPRATAPAERQPRSPMMILGQLMIFGVLALVLGSIAFKLVASRRPNRPVAPAPPDHIPWRSDFAAALSDSQKTGKPLLVDFSASWCPPCQHMRQDAWPDPRVGQLVRDRYIPVLMDADQPESRGPGARYDIQEIPAILVVDGNGKVLRQGAFMSADELIKFLNAG